MKQIATVVVQNGKLMAEVIRPEACEACHACKYGRQEHMLLELPSGSYKEGDEVELNLPDGQVGKASLIAYGLPLAFLLIGLWLGGLLGKGELVQALGAVVMVGLSVIVLKLMEPRLRKNGQFAPRACPHERTNDE